jgi:hypothetical protein
VPIRNFAGDVTKVGYSIAVDADDVPTVPEDYPTAEYRGLPVDAALERWASQCYIDGWSYDADFSDLLEQFVIDRRGRRGTALVEHAYDDPTERRRILGLRDFAVETVTAYTRAGQGIALRPDDDGQDVDFTPMGARRTLSGARDTPPTTPAGKTAAISQYDDIFGAHERDENPFALDDITVSAYDADTGELFGRPDTARVVDRAEALVAKLEYVDEAVRNTA